MIIHERKTGGKHETLKKKKVGEQVAKHKNSKCREITVYCESDQSLQERYCYVVHYNDNFMMWISMRITIAKCNLLIVLFPVMLFF